MAKNRNTFEKSRREVEKRRKADDKRARKKTRKENGPSDEVRPSDDPQQAF
ncbi:MAG: hypothetical protein K8T25_07895 [Planctomycetia bacterium]|nr:hypothetical protein [Planctomycetia bacterium]